MHDWKRSYGSSLPVSLLWGDDGGRWKFSVSYFHLDSDFISWENEDFALNSRRLNLVSLRKVSQDAATVVFTLTLCHKRLVKAQNPPKMGRNWIYVVINQDIPSITQPRCCLIQCELPVTCPVCHGGPQSSVSVCKGNTVSPNYSEERKCAGRGDPHLAFISHINSDPAFEKTADFVERSRK